METTTPEPSTSSVPFTVPSAITLKSKTKICAQAPSRNELPEIYQFFQQYCKDGVEVGAGEFRDVDDFVEKMMERKNCVYRDQDTGDIVFYTSFTDSPLCRGATWCTAYSVGRSDYPGLFSELHAHITTTGRSHGYAGIATRVGLLNSPALRSVVGRATFLGVIPKSFLLKANRWVDDVVVCSKYPGNVFGCKGTALEKEFRKLPFCKCAVSDSLDKSYVEGISTRYTHPNGDDISIDVATDTDIMQIEYIIRQNAEQGLMFGLDEFTGAGSYNRSMLSTHVTVVAMNARGAVLGGAFIGGSTLCRSVHSPNLAFYPVLETSYSSWSVLKLLFQYCRAIAEKHKKQGIITDVLCDGSDLANNLMSLGFSATASVPKSAYIKGMRFVDSLVLHYDVDVSPPFAKL